MEGYCRALLRHNGGLDNNGDANNAAAADDNDAETRAPFVRGLEDAPVVSVTYVRNWCHHFRAFKTNEVRPA